MVNLGCWWGVSLSCPASHGSRICLCSTSTFQWSPESVFELRDLGWMVPSPRAPGPWLMSSRGQNVLGTWDQPFLS